MTITARSTSRRAVRVLPRPLPVRRLVRRRASSTAVLFAAAAVLSACGTTTSPVAANSAGTTITKVNATSVTSTTPVPQATATSTSATPPTSAGPRVCGKDMGSTLLPPGTLYPSPTAPDGWQSSRVTPFDWNQDGKPDELVVRDDRVVVRWATGELVVTGVRTDWYTRPFTDDNGEVFQPVGEGAKVYSDRHTPASVGDVTGDGLPDLVVSNLGHTSVLIGPGSGARSGELTFAELGVERLGWRSPPLRMQSGTLVPAPVADVEVIWDVNGDGARDYTVTRLAPSGGRSGPERVFFFGILCELPSPTADPAP